MPSHALFSARVWILILTFANVFLDNAAGQESPQPMPQAIVLNDVSPGEGATGGMLMRELVRQAVSMTAREEFHLLTRDAVLGEVLPDDSTLATLPLDIAAEVSDEGSVKIRITLHKPDEMVELTEIELKFDPEAVITSTTSQLEQKSREELVAMFERAGFKRRALPKAEPKPGAPMRISDKLAKQLCQLSPIVQFAAIRSLHGEIRKSGESPELLAALARAYANLGTLTELNWSPAHKVFKARALLYAERLHAKSPGTDSLAARGYVRALVGLPQEAVNDLLEIDEMGATKQPAETMSEESKLIDAYCFGDIKRMTKAARRVKHKLLAHYLILLTVENCDLQILRQQAAEAVLKIDRANVRALESMNHHAPLGILRGVAMNAPRRFAPSLFREVAEIDDPSEAIRDLLKSTPAEGDESTPQVAELTQALLNHGEGEQDENEKPREDVAEPSLAVVGNLVREVNFLHAWRLVSVERHALDVNADASLRKVLPLVEGHRYQTFLETHVWDQQTAHEAWESLTDLVDDPHLEATEEPMLDMMKGLGFPQANRLLGAALDHNDYILRDLLNVTQRSPSNAIRSYAAATLYTISPESPVVIATVIDHAWEVAEESVKDWEEEHSEDPIVQDTLARRFAAVNKVEDAIRCLQRRIAILPDWQSYQRLAALKLSKGDEEGWVETLVKSLTLPSQGLEDATTRVKLAEHFAKKKDLQTACKYADDAAVSGAGWAFFCAAKCHELAGDWETAEKFVRDNSQRYSGWEMDWYFWCHRTGQGDFTSARKQARKAVTQFTEASNAMQQQHLALFYYSEEKDDQALEVLQAAFAKNRNEQIAVCGALLADEMGQVAVRDKFLEDAQRLANAKVSHFGTIIHDFRNALRSEGAIPLDLKTTELNLHLQPEDEVANHVFYVGKFLLLHGREEEGLRLLQLAATSPESTSHGSLWASFMLARRQVPRQPLRHSAWAGEGKMEQMIEFLTKAYELAPTGDFDAAQRLLGKALEIDPDFADAWLARATFYMAEKKNDQAVTNLLRCKQLLPKSTEVSFHLAACYEELSNFSAAIAEYELAIKLNPYQGNGHKVLAHLLSTVRDDKVRDGKKAVEHAKRALTMQDTVPESQKRAVLAFALAEAGDFAEAIKQYEIVIRMAPPEAREELVLILEQFRQNKPYRRPLKDESEM